MYQSDIDSCDNPYVEVIYVIQVQERRSSFSNRG
jgi:hypothetical protein